jgi:predicted enzyme related to lactoylglutathione lyase
MGNPVTRWQILTSQPEKLARFYSDLFGWQISTDNPFNAHEVDTGSDRGIPGGFWPAPPEAKGFMQMHVEVDDLERQVGKAKALGATEIIGPQTLPQGGKMAVMHDPEGIPFVLHEPA